MGISFFSMFHKKLNMFGFKEATEDINFSGKCGWQLIIVSCRPTSCKYWHGTSTKFYTFLCALNIKGTTILKFNSLGNNFNEAFFCVHNTHKGRGDL